MNISTIIAKLTSLKAQYGDCEVMCSLRSNGFSADLDVDFVTKAKYDNYISILCVPILTKDFNQLKDRL